MEYDHGVCVTKRLHEMTPLERIMADFEQKCKKYHTDKDEFDVAKKAAKKGNGIKPSKADEKALSKKSRELNRLLKQLAAERLATLTQVSVQDSLEKYRTELKPSEDSTRKDRSIHRNAMGIEAHHPTKVLAKFMEDDGRHAPDPKSRFTAHHIVQGKGRTRFAAEARVDMHFHGIRINDPDNGVWMPREISDKGHPAMRHANAHAEIHTYNYEHWVHNRSRNIVNEGAFRGKLLSIRTLLRDGQQPDYVTEPPLEEVFKP
ncbi:MAG: AHH domain-containing protein [Endozoicomonas sp.]|uniref:AHH domain-containing protein n=1 Tax=Endozoicomonas sp. TaxID=1892382 RepID=UPI003D9AEF90